MSGEFQRVIEMAERGTADERLLARQFIGGILDAVQQAVAVVGPEAAARHGFVAPPEIAAWVAAEQLKVADGVDPKVALHLKVSKNKTISYIRTKLSRDAVRAAQDAGMTWEEAIALEADKRGIEPETLAQQFTRMNQTLP